MLYFEKESYRDCIENFVLDLEDSLGRIQDEGEHYCSDFSFHFEYLKKGFLELNHCFLRIIASLLIRQIKR
jgi:hypothetical protein